MKRRVKTNAPAKPQGPLYDYVTVVHSTDGFRVYGWRWSKGFPLGWVIETKEDAFRAAQTLTSKGGIKFIDALAVAEAQK